MFNRSKSDKPRKASLAAHPAFKVIVSLWAAALFGLGVFVWTAQPLFAAGAALFGGTMGLFVARMLAASAGMQKQGKVTVPSDTTNADETESSVEPEEVIETRDWDDDKPQVLDIAALGHIEAEDSEEPEFGVEETLASEDHAWTDPVPVLIAARKAIENAGSHSENLDEETVEFTFDSGEKDAVPEPEVCETSETPTPPETEVATEPEVESAADVLRSQDVAEMSLVQLIERFALALDDHREARAKTDRANTTSLPDPALVEALRALPLITGSQAPQFATDGNAALAISTREQAEATERALREALEKLQRMSGG